MTAPASAHLAVGQGVDLRGMRVGVTGASGFCGSVVARAAASAGADVVTLGRRPGPTGTHRSWDAATQAPDLAGLDVVVHLAATVGDAVRGPASTSFEEVNVRGALRLLHAAEAVRVTWVSSASVYDPRPDRSCVTEDHPTSDGHLNAYGRTKAAGERLALAAGHVVLRPHAVYGPGDRHLLPRLLRATRGGRIVLPGASVPVSLTAVENLASASLHGLGWAAGAYNVADPVPYDRDAALVRVLSAATGRPVRVVHAPVGLASAAARAGRLASLVGRTPLLTPYVVDQLARPFVLDTSKARRAGWEPVAGLGGGGVPTSA